MKKKILYIQYTNPAGYPSLQHSSQILAKDGWNVVFLGTGAFGAGSIKFPEYPGIKVKLIPFCSKGWRQKLHFIYYILWCLYWVFIYNPSWIYSSDTLSCAPALLIRMIFRKKIIYHEHDSPSVLMGKKKLAGRFLVTIRSIMSKKAEFCILPNQQRVDIFLKEMKGCAKTICVWNCPGVDDPIYEKSENRSEKVRILYHGSITPERIPVSVIEALVSLPEQVKLCIAGYETIGSLGYVELLRKMVSKLGLNDRLEIGGTFAYRKDLLDYARKCSVGMALMPISSADVNMRFMTGASNKPFDYMACGLALIVSDLPDWRKMYVEPGYGVACDPSSAGSIRDAIQWYLDHPDQMKGMGEAGRRRIVDDWNYDKQFVPVMERLNHG